MSYDDVNHPAHYNRGGIECIDAIEAATGEHFPGYLQGNAIKYLYRHRYKDNPVQDLDKAIWYINKLKEQYEIQRLPNENSGNSDRRRSESPSGRERDSNASFPWNREIPETD